MFRLGPGGPVAERAPAGLPDPGTGSGHAKHTKGRLTRVWYRKRARPRGVRQRGFSAAHPFGAVCPERGEGVAPVLPGVSATATDVFLAQPSRAVPAGSRAGL